MNRASIHIHHSPHTHTPWLICCYIPGRTLQCNRALPGEYILLCLQGSRGSETGGVQFRRFTRSQSIKKRFKQCAGYFARLLKVLGQYRSRSLLFPYNNLCILSSVVCNFSIYGSFRLLDSWFLLSNLQHPLPSSLTPSPPSNTNPIHSPFVNPISAGFTKFLFFWYYSWSQFWPFS